MKIVAYETTTPDNKILLEQSNGEYVMSNNITKLLEFLLEPFDDTIKVCWDLDATVAVLLKQFPVIKAIRLHQTKRCYLPPFNIQYYPDKVFIVTHIPTKEKAFLYGLKQYYPDIHESVDIGIAHSLGQELLRELKKMNLEPTKLTSPVAIFEQCVMRDLDLPQFIDIPADVAEFAYRCSGRLWIEAHKIGYFENIYDYDLKSAFPNTAKDLYDIRYVKWKRNNEYQKSALYGYAKTEVTICDHVKVSPIITEYDDMLISPTGTWIDYYTKDELDFITEHDIGTYEILDGWWALPRIRLERIPKPLKKVVTDLLKYKQGHPLQSMLAKRMATGLYGKFGEEHDDGFGNYFNPVYFAEISTKARLKLAKFIYDNNLDVIQIGVDGVTSITPTENIDSEWKEAVKKQLLSVSSGLIYTNTTKPKGLTLGRVLVMINEHPKQGYYNAIVRRRLTLGDAVAQERITEVGNMVEFNSSINLFGAQHDREFKKLPETGYQLLNKVFESEPIKI